MGNLIELPNINPESLVMDGETTKKGNGNFSLKNYLDLRVEEGQGERTVTIRLLPMDLETGNPFVKVHVHNVKVPKELVKPGQKPFKDFICLKKNHNIDHEKFGNKCPFCEINNKAYEESEKATDPVQKKEWQDISLDNLSREAVIFRCIERGKENEGVKFCKVKIRKKDKSDIYNQILKLYQVRKASAEKKGLVENILDIYNGRDLNITVYEDQGTSAPQVIDDSTPSPLSTDEEQMRKWIYDEKKWEDVFTCKPYDYLKLVSEMRVPWYDKENGVWVDKEEYEKVHGTQKTEADKDANEASDKLKNMANNAEKQTESPKDEERKAAAEKIVEETRKEATFAASITVEDEDLPF